MTPFFHQSKAALAACGAALVLAAYVWVIWSPHELSAGEGAANLAKAKEVWGSLTHSGGASWWSPSFMGGTPLATASGTFLTSLWLLGWTSVLGDHAGIKLAILSCLPLASLSMFLFARKMCGNGKLALIVSLSYLSAPSLWLRALGVEHVVMVMAMAWLPLVCLALLTLAQRPTFQSAFLFALSCSVLALIYIKVAVIFAPALLLFGIWCVWKHHGLAAWSPPRIWMTILLVLLALVVIPNLPSLREARSAVLFEQAPLSYWKILYSSRNGLHFLDRLGLFYSDLSGGLPKTTASGAYYLGLLPFFCLTLVLLFRKKFLDTCPPAVASSFRVSLVISLFCFWLSLGPLAAFPSTLLTWLGSGSRITFGSLLLWLFLIAPPFLIWISLPKDFPFRRPIALLSILVFLFVPSLLLLSWIPLYQNLRAPFDFYQICGVVWTSIATGIALHLVFKQISRPTPRFFAICLAVLFCVWDFSPYWRPDRSTTLSSDVQSDFKELSRFLKENSRPGAIQVFSSHYYYMQLAKQTGRPLLQESFQSYLQQRDLAALFTAAGNSPSDYLQALRLAGAGFVIIDLQHPILREEILDGIRQRLIPVFRNKHFEALAFEHPLFPAYLVKDPALVFAESSPSTTGSRAGSGNHPASINLQSLIRESGNNVFEILPQSALTSIHPGLFEIQNPGKGGWLIIPTAWHVDWKAEARGGPLTVFKTFTGLLAVEAGTAPQVIRFEFTPPWWYSASAVAGAVFWASSLLFSLLLLSPRFRKLCSHRANPPIPAMPPTHIPLQRPLAISPTYNESASLPILLEKLLAADPRLDILIIDDASPDGTASLVQKHSLFQKRIFLLQRSGKQGLGSAYRDGFRWAMEQGYDTCIEIDADLSHNPGDVPRLLAALETGYDAAIGTRYLDGYRVVNWSQIRLFISSFATQFVKFFLGLPLSDVTSGFKALRTETLRSLDWSLIQAEGYAFQVELHYALWKKGARIIEIPITFTERLQGCSKMSLRIATEAVFRVFLLTLQKY